jgi:hypothetical protein
MSPEGLYPHEEPLEDYDRDRDVDAEDEPEEP